MQMATFKDNIFKFNFLCEKFYVGFVFGMASLDSDASLCSNTSLDNEMMNNQVKSWHASHSFNPITELIYGALQF